MGHLPFHRTHVRTWNASQRSKDHATAELSVVIAFSLIGLLLSLIIILRFPDFGELVTQYSQF